MDETLVCFPREEWEQLIAEGGLLQRVGAYEVPLFEVKLLRTKEGIEVVVPRQELSLYLRAASRKGFVPQTEADRLFLKRLAGG